MPWPFNWSVDWPVHWSVDPLSPPRVTSISKCYLLAHFNLNLSFWSFVSKLIYSLRSIRSSELSRSFKSRLTDREFLQLSSLSRPNPLTRTRAHCWPAGRPCVVCSSSPVLVRSERIEEIHFAQTVSRLKDLAGLAGCLAIAKLAQLVFLLFGVEFTLSRTDGLNRNEMASFRKPKPSPTL